MQSADRPLPPAGKAENVQDVKSEAKALPTHAQNPAPLAKSTVVQTEQFSTAVALPTALAAKAVPAEFRQKNTSKMKTVVIACIQNGSWLLIAQWRDVRLMCAGFKTIQKPLNLSGVCICSRIKT